MIFSLNCVRNTIFNYAVRYSRLTFSFQLSTTKWQVPDGHDTGIRLYNITTREKVPLILKTKGLATWYTCGPTVYSDAHLGHASCYVKFDIIRRILEEIFNINVVMLMGITDIDDKIINKAAKENSSISEITKRYEKSFFADMDALDVKRPSMIARVTQSIPEIIYFCQSLIEKEYAYVTTEGNVYFIVSKVETGDIPTETEFRETIDPLKKDPRDFALWKSSKPGEPYWMSPWGDGRPGWHIECSAMASQIFGHNLDIHSGGADLIFPHHANEKSQSEAYHDVDQWVNYWIHAGILHVEDDAKMSKSLGNIISIRDFLQANSSNVFRMLCLQSTYRNSIQYTSQTVELATNVCSKFHMFLNEIELYLTAEVPCQPFNFIELQILLIKTQELVIEALKDDFNTSESLKLLLNLVSRTHHYLQPAVEPQKHSGFMVLAAIVSYINKIFRIFGIDIITKKKLDIEFESFVNNIVQFRNAVRCLALSGNFENNSYKLLQEIYVEQIRRNFPNYNTHKLMDAIQNFSTVIRDIVSETVTEENNVKIKIPILKTCDHFRQELFDLGIHIKDMKNSTVWFPKENVFEPAK